MNKLLLNAVVSLVGGIAIVVLRALGIIEDQLMTILLGLVGFGSIAQLRAAIDSSGYKTYIVAGGGALLMVLYGAGLLPIDGTELLLSLLGIGLPAAGLTLKHGVQKAGAVKK